MLTGDLEGPLDDLRGLGEGELEALGEWEGRFEEKYLVVGRLVAGGRAGVAGRVLVGRVEVGVGVELEDLWGFGLGWRDC